MSITVKVRFTAGRFHATPWGRHVNEGVAEWPPSPWRVLRALVAVWRRTRPDIPHASIQRVLEPLLTPPSFFLPPHRVAHTRHYMPWEKKGPQDRTLVFDNFVSISRDEPLLMHWPQAQLQAEDRALLSSLVENLPSLGRAESWVDASLTDESREWNCEPAADDNNPVAVFCSDPTALATEHYPVHDAKSLKRGIKPEAFLFDCPPWHLCLDTQIIHAKRWPIVPGARWVNYCRPIELVPRRARREASSTMQPTVARFVLDGPVLPLATETMRIAELFRNQAMGQFQGWCKRNEKQAAMYLRLNTEPEMGPRYSSENFSGKDCRGQILDARKHAYFLPITDGRRITHISLFAPNGFDAGEVNALAAIRKLMKDDDKLQCRLIGLLPAAEIASPLFAASRCWVSVTPFLGPAHIGLRSQSRFMRKAIRREWLRLSEQVRDWAGIKLQEITEVSVEDLQRSGRPMPREYRRVRLKHGGAYRPCRMFRLEFTEAIRGPLALGYASHFGMGLFEPVR